MMADGPIVAIMSQHTNFGVGQMIHFRGLMEDIGALIDDKLRTAGESSALLCPRETPSVHMHKTDFHALT